jgi:hypothetical protein
MFCGLFLLLLSPAHSDTARVTKDTLLSNSDFFPLAVWLQRPALAPKYKKLGINLYVGLWKGPTAAQLATLKRAAMPVIAAQNTIGLTDPNRDIIVGWMQKDEPDNSQKRKFSVLYQPPIPPADIIARYREIRRKDPTRPVLLNLGQGVAWDQWHGRGTRTNHPEDYVEYVKGADIVAFDIYPVTHRHADVKGRLEFVAKGVTRLKNWAGNKRRVWNAIGITGIHNPTVKPTAVQVRAQVWLSIIHGSRGIIYFVHQFKPTFDSAAIFRDGAVSAEVARNNRLIRKLAPVLNSPDAPEDITIATSSPKVKIAVLAKRSGDNLYLFTANARGAPGSATFTLPHTALGRAVEIFPEVQAVPVKDKSITASYLAYGVRIFKLHAPRQKQ